MPCYVCSSNPHTSPACRFNGPPSCLSGTAQTPTNSTDGVDVTKDGSGLNSLLEVEAGGVPGGSETGEGGETLQGSMRLYLVNEQQHQSDWQEDLLQDFVQHLYSIAFPDSDCRNDGSKYFVAKSQHHLKGIFRMGERE